MRAKITRSACLFVTLTLLVFFSSAIGASAETINVVSLVPGEGQLRDKFLATKQRIENGWNGQADVVLLIDGQVGSEESMIATVRRDSAQIGMLTAAGTSSAIPEMSLLMAPFLFDSFAEADFVLDAFITPKVTEMFADKGLVFIQWIDSGWFNVFAKTPLRVPQDVTGLRMRAAGGPAARVFLQEVGADVAQLQFADLVPGLQSGLLTGGATNTPMYRTVALYELAPYITLTRHGLNPGAVFANKSWFNSLLPLNQALVMSGIAQTTDVRSAVRKEGVEALEYSVSQGATIITLTSQERSTWKQATAASHSILIDEIGGEAAALYYLIQAGKSAFAAGEFDTGAVERDASR